MWRRIAVAWLIANLIFPNIALADTLTITAWSDGNSLNASNLNQRHTDIQNIVNGNLSDANIKSGAAIAGSKIDLTTGTSRISNSAGTITSDLNAINSSATWNSVSVKFTGWKLNVSITAASADSRLAALQADSVDVLWVGRSGQLYLIPASLSGTSLGTSSGAWLTVASGAFSDTNTAASGTSTSWVAHMFGTPVLKAKNTSVTTSSTATVYISAGPLAGSNMTLTKSWPLWVGSGAIRADGGVEFSDGSSLTSALQNLGGSIWGGTLSNGTDATNDIDIAAGEAVSDDALIANRRLMTISALTKQTDAAWAVGTNQGCWDTGSVANGMAHVFAIFRTDTSVTDVLCSASATSPTMPASYTKKRRLGSLPRASGSVIGFVQNDDRFDLKIPYSAVNTNNPGTSAVTAQLGVASGASVEAIIGVSAVTGAGGGFVALLTNPGTTDTGPSAMSHNVRMPASSEGGGEFRIRTNTSGQIRYRLDFSDAGVTIRMTNIGWIDRRGRDS